MLKESRNSRGQKAGHVGVPTFVAVGCVVVVVDGWWLVVVVVVVVVLVVMVVVMVVVGGREGRRVAVSDCGVGWRQHVQQQHGSWLAPRKRGSTC